MKTRREVLQAMGIGILALNLPVWAHKALAESLTPLHGMKLDGPDENGLMLPEGFTSRIVARTSKLVKGTGYIWHRDPDGGAVLPVSDGGWIYVSNSESKTSFANPMGGGVGAIRFDKSGEIVDAYRILKGTKRNCAGGLTPWGTWLSCEEFDHSDEDDYNPEKGRIAGQVWETFPLEPNRPAVVHPLMGSFQHEAAAFDEEGRVYLTEDQKDGCFYRYSPARSGDLSHGILEVAKLDFSNTVRWVPVPDPELKTGRPTRFQVRGVSRFRGGEGAAFFEGRIYFTTKHDNRVWFYDVRQHKIDILYDPRKTSRNSLRGVDNVTITPAGQVLVAEDGGNQELCAVNSRGESFPILRVPGHRSSDMAGPAFTPDGSRLYFSSQRGREGKSTTGVTYEVTGPFADLVV